MRNCLGLNFHNPGSVRIGSVLVILEMLIHDLKLAQIQPGVSLLQGQAVLCNDLRSRQKMCEPH